MTCHGANLIPEGLETGDYEVGGTAEIDDLEPVYIVAYGKETDFGYTYNGIFSGILFYAFSSIAGLRGFLTQISLADPPRNTIYNFNIYRSKTCFLSC